MLNLKYADLRHAPRLDPELLRYDPSRTPQSTVRMGPACRRKVKGGVVLAEPGFVWAVSLFPGRLYAITTVFDTAGARRAHHVDIACPPEERDGVLSFLDLKLDLILPEGAAPLWVDHDEYNEEVRQGTIGPSLREAVARTVDEIHRSLGEGSFPPPSVRDFRPRVEP